MVRFEMSFNRRRPKVLIHAIAMKIFYKSIFSCVVIYSFIYFYFILFHFFFNYPIGAKKSHCK